MNRLTDIYNGSLHSHIAYDPLGRMTDKQANGQAIFSNANFAAPQGQAARPHAMKSPETAEGVFPSAQQQITYTGFDKVRSILEDGNGIIITYGHDQQRIQSYLLTSDNRFLNKDYVGVCEYNTEYFADGSATQTTLTYLVGPYGVFAVVEKENNSESIHYILKDHLGSWTTITDSEGNVEQEISFDAWGNLRDPETWLNYPTDEPAMALMFDRGFTGHEHLYAFGLINMNGRIYDPQMSSFLSVDAYVQSPDNAQSFNRYAYCQNNPLRYVDPSGWLMLGAGHGTSFNNNPGWGESYSHHAYEPRELGMLQLPGCSVMTWWMEGDNMLGGGGGGGCSGVDQGTKPFIRRLLSSNDYFHYYQSDRDGINPEGRCKAAAVRAYYQFFTCIDLGESFFWNAIESMIKINHNKSFKQVLEEWFYVQDGIGQTERPIGFEDIVQHLEQDHLYSVLIKTDNTDNSIFENHVVTVVDFSKQIEKPLQVWYKDPMIKGNGLVNKPWNDFVNTVTDAYIIIGVK